MSWQMSEEVRKMIDFQPTNLIESWPPTQLMDIILIRNVLIYFDIPTKKEILARVRRVKKQDGYLFLGGAENAISLDDALTRVELEQCSVYRLRSCSTN